MDGDVRDEAKGPDPRELGRRRDLWSTCAGQKVVARMLAGAYDERAEETIPNNQGGFTRRWSAGGAHWALPMQRAQCRMNGKPLLRGYVDLGGYYEGGSEEVGSGPDDGKTERDARGAREMSKASEGRGG